MTHLLDLGYLNMHPFIILLFSCTVIFIIGANVAHIYTTYLAHSVPIVLSTTLTPKFLTVHLPYSDEVSFLVMLFTLIFLAPCVDPDKDLYSLGPVS